MTPNTRPLSEIEKRTLEQLGHEPTSKTVPLLVGLGGWGITINLAIALDTQFHLLEAAWASYFFAFVAVFWLAVGIGLARLQPQRRSPFGELCQKDLEGGVMQVFSFSAKEAIRVKATADDGSQYFIRLGDDSVLFLRGQYLYNSETRKEFPSTEFEIAQSPHARIVFGIICHGTYLPPVKEFKAFRAELIEKGEAPQDIELLNLPWSEIESRYF